MLLVSSCSCLFPIHWSQVLSREWRCSWSSTDRRCSNCIWVMNKLITYWAAYIRRLTVFAFTIRSRHWDDKALKALFVKDKDPFILHIDIVNTTAADDQSCQGVRSVYFWFSFSKYSSLSIVWSKQWHDNIIWCCDCVGKLTQLGSVGELLQYHCNYMNTINLHSLVYENVKPLYDSRFIYNMVLLLKYRP